MNRIKISSTMKKYEELDKLLSAPNSENMEETVLDYIKQVNLMKNSLYSLEMNQEKLNKKLIKSIQKIGVLRYSAFENMGSDLSFSIALLDEKLSGVIITSIYSGDQSNIYAKPMVEGVSTHDLSKEEQQVLEIAMDGSEEVKTQES